MYGHLSRILVAAGDSVASGQVIGLSGNTGRSSAPHLHFEIRQRGLSLDPQTLVKEGG
jgi:murein DD-endopeptidase MepM/ murein hydrolase activator NlpD